MISDNEMIMKIDKGFSDYIGEARYISGKDNLTHLYLCFKMASIPIIKKNSELQDRLSEAEKVIEFYGDKKNWKICDQYKPWNNFSVIKEDLDEENANMALWTVYAGKRAREYQAKWKEKV